MLIFAIDDELPMLEQLHEAIGEAEPDAEIMDFTRASDALRTITERELRPDVVFSDIELPGMDGLSFAVRIKNEMPTARIVFVTGYSQYAVEAYRRHVNGYILKPVDAESIRDELDHLPPPPEPEATPTPTPAPVPGTESSAPTNTPESTPTPVPGEPETPLPSDAPDTDTENPFSPDDRLYEFFEEQTPLTEFQAKLYPSGGRGGACWALLNLICLILTFFIFLPVHKLRAKFGRRRLMAELNEQHLRLLDEGWLVDNGLERDKSIGASMFRGDGAVKTAADSMDRIEDVDEIRARAGEEKAEDELYRVKKFTWKFWIGVVLELIISIVALKGFIDTEDMRLPMVIIDIWTPIMIFWLAACWLTDVLLVRYRRKVEIEDEIEVEIVDLTEEAEEASAQREV